MTTPTGAPVDPLCTDGCPLTNPADCAVGCLRAARRPVYVTVPDPVPAPAPGPVTHVGTEPSRPRPKPRPKPRPRPADAYPPPDDTGTVRITPDMPYRWRGTVALLLVVVLAIVCAAAGWTR